MHNLPGASTRHTRTTIRALTPIAVPSPVIAVLTGLAVKAGFPPSLAAIARPFTENARLYRHELSGQTSRTTPSLICSTDEALFR